MMRLLRSCLGAVCASLLVVAQGNAQTVNAPLPAAATPDVATLRNIESQVAAIRGLPVVSEPELRVFDQVALREYLAQAFERDYLPSERESDQAELVILGLIQPTDDLTQIQLDLLTQQVVGVYDPDDKSTKVVGDQGPFGPAEKITYAHEFDHALQDQYFNLSSIAPKHPDSNDHSLAVHALVEGDAVMLQTLWAQENLTPSDLMELAQGAAGSGDSLRRVPMVVRSELLFPYTDGFTFVRQAYRQAGNDYGAIDAMFRSPPESTAQVLHPDRYVNHIHPISVELPDLAPALGSAWRKVGSGVLGELDTRALLEQWGSDHAEASRVASGWTGDAWRLVEKDGRPAIVVKSTWDSPDSAADFFNAYAHGLRTRFDLASVEVSSANRQALTTPAAATDVRLEGSEVVVVIAADRDDAQAVVEAGTSTAP